MGWSKPIHANFVKHFVQIVLGIPQGDDLAYKRPRARNRPGSLGKTGVYLIYHLPFS